MATYDNDAKLSGGGNWWWNTYAEDVTGQDGYVDGCQMYAEQYHVLKGSDGKTCHLMEIRIKGS